MSKIKIITFGVITDKINEKEFVVEGINDTDSLMIYLIKQYPSLIDAKMSIAVNKNIIEQNTALSENSEVALLPPFSGG